MHKNYICCIIISLLYTSDIQTSSAEGFHDVGFPQIEKSEKEERANCFCAWCNSFSQPTCFPQKSDCRFYQCCAPCVSISDRLQSNCGSSEKHCWGEYLAIIFCPCVIQDIQ